MTTWYLEVPGEPVPMGRPKSRVVKGADGRAFSRHYTPARTRAALNVLRAVVAQAAPDALFAGPLDVDVELALPVPKSAPKWRHEAAQTHKVRPAKKPDIDNLAKTILDACTGIVWRDDAQIVELRVSKTYGRPATRIRVRRIAEPMSAKEWREGWA